MVNETKSIICVVGPTASGKTDVSFLLARQMKAEIVSADSMLVYQEPKIITSKPPLHMLEEVKHHFVGMIPVEKNYSVFDYFTEVGKKIKQLVSKNIPIIVCGGSGLYVKVILDGIFKGPGADDALRKKLDKAAQIHGKEYLFEKLKEVDAQSAEKISSGDLKRIIRALEVYYLSGVTMSEKRKQAFGLWGKMPTKIFGLRLKRPNLYERINKRVDRMFNSGAIEEVESLLKMNLNLTAGKIIGIKEIGEFLSGKISREEARERMKKNTRNLAKRQVTWFKKDKRIDWIDVDNLSFDAARDAILRSVYG